MISRTTGFHRKLRVPMHWSMGWIPYLHNYKIEAIFKKSYSVSNKGVVSYNKSFLYAAVEAPGSTHDSRLLKNTRLYH